MTLSRTLFDPKLLRRRLAGVLAASIIASLVVFSVFTLALFDRAIAPEIESRTKLIGTLIRGEVQRTLELGIPIASLGGLDAYLDTTLADFPEVSRIALLSASGEMIAEAERDEAPGWIAASGIGARIGIGGTRFAFPILAQSAVVGEIVVEGSPTFVETRLRDVVLDTSVLAVSILLIGVELVLAAVALALWKPMRRIDALLAEQCGGVFAHVIPATGIGGLRRVAARLSDHARDLAARRAAGALGGVTGLRLSDLADIRIPLFLFALATETTASFLPVFARAAERPNSFSPELAAAAPLLAYLVGVAALSPVAGALSRRVGARALFLLSVPPVVLALGVMAATESVAVIALARGAIAVFYALATVACQEYALRADEGAARAGVSSAFVAAVYGGAFCGSVIGGVIAGRFGYPAAIWTGAAFALGAGAAAWAVMGGRAGDPARAPGLVERHAAGPAADRVRFGALAGFVALPANAVTAIFIWYFTPLALAEEGLRAADIARVVMSYYLATVLLGPVAAAASRRPGTALASVLAGAALSGAGLLSLALWPGFWAHAVAVAILGIGHALMRAPVLALALRWAGPSLRAISLFRLLERLGAMAGLVAAVFWLGDAGIGGIPTALGFAVLAGMGMFALVVMLRGGVRGEP